MRIDFASEADYQAAAARLRTLEQAQWPDLGQVSYAAGDLALHVSHGVLAQLLQRLATGEPTVIPDWRATTDHWQLVAPDPAVAARLLSHVAAFLLPAYGRAIAPTDHGDIPPFRIGQAKPTRPALVWQTPADLRSHILDKLGDWLQLERTRPTLRVSHQATYAQLLDQWQAAVAATDWPAATAALNEIERRHLCSFENLQYLRLQLLAHRQDWAAIWRDPVYTALASTSRLPRVVRAALIQAYHHAELLPFELENRYDQALAHFRASADRVHRLLDGRHGLSTDPVVRTFAYAAVRAEDRAALDQLRALPDLTVMTYACLDALATLLPVPALPIPTVSDFSTALRRKSYDVALELAEAIPDGIERTLALCRVAAFYPGAEANAIAAWNALAVEDREWLFHDPTFSSYRAIVLPPPPRPAIQSWEAWFTAFNAEPDLDVLSDALDDLGADVDDLHLPPRRLETLATGLEQAALGDANQSQRNVLRRASAILTNALLADSQFPQRSPGYAQLYDACYNALLLHEPANAENLRRITRLVEAVLLDDPARIPQFAADLSGWAVVPAAPLEAAYLDLLELLIDAGAPKPALMAWVRTWLTFLLDRPDSARWPRTYRAVWHELVDWLAVGEDLRHALQQRDAVQAAAALEAGDLDPLRSLPNGLTIGIFVGQEVSSVRRAQTILTQRNPNLDIRVVAAADMNDRVQAQARHVDWAVVVTTYMSHAIFYGIKEYLAEDPIYPRSRGTAAIVDAVEERARLRLPA